MKLPAAICGVSKRNCAVALTRLRSIELRRGSPCLSSLLQAAVYSGEGESTDDIEETVQGLFLGLNAL